MNEDLRTGLTKQIDECPWTALAPHFARGVVVIVSPTLNFLEVAVAIAEDNAKDVEKWMSANLLANATDHDAESWQENPKVSFKMVVVAPYVLVQKLKTS